MIAQYQHRFDYIVRTDTPKYRKALKLALLMTDMEDHFKIPALNDEEYNNANPEVIRLYRKIADARNTLM